MSRVGKQPIPLPEKVSLKLGDDRSILVEGPKGKLSWSLPEGLELTNENSSVEVKRLSEERKVRALHGTAQRLIGNMVHGVSQGFSRNLEIHGVGFRAAVKGSHIDLNLGQSHPRLHPIPEGVKVTVTENTKIAIEGIKAKGVRYAGEHIRRKAGKSVK